MDEIMGEMAAPATTSLDEDEMCELFGKLFRLSDDGLESSEEYSVLTKALMVEERRCLNLNGVLGLYPEADRTRALTFVFRLADRASVQSLLLEGNGIDDACLKASLQDYMPQNANHHSTKLPKDSKKTSIQFLQALQEVDLSDNHLRGEGMEAFCAIHWAQLRKLVLRGTGMRAIGCKHIENAIQAGNLETLESLDLYGNQITDLGISNLAASFQRKCPPNLREIILGNNEFGDSGVRAIAKAISAGALQHLENIDLSSSEKNPYSHASSSSFTITESTMVHLASSMGQGKVRNLKVLNLRRRGMGDGAVRRFAEALQSGNLKSLEKLDFSDNWEYVPYARMDKALSDLAGALGAGHAPNLRDLRLKGPGCPPRWWDKLKKKHSPPFAREGGIELVRAIKAGGLKMLEGLHLSGNWDEENVTLGFVVEALGKGHIANLKELRLSGIQRESHGENDDEDDREDYGEIDTQRGCVVELAKVLASGSLKSLEKLELSCNYSQRVTGHDQALVSLAASLADGHAVNLRELTLNRFQVGVEGMDGFTKATESGNLKLLEKLDLSQTSVNSKPKTPLVEPLVASLGNGQMVNLKELSLRLGLKNDGLLKLAEVMASGGLESLEVLGVEGIHQWETTDESLKAFAAALGKEHVVKLRALNLSFVHWNGAGIFKLANAIRSGHLKSLETLSISGIEGTGADAPLTNLAAAVGSGQMTHMKKLLLKNAGLGREGAIALADAMGCGRLPSLQKVDLVDNPEVNAECADSFRRALETGRVPHIKELLVGWDSGDSTSRPSSPRPPIPRFQNVAESYLDRRRNGLRGIGIPEDSSTSLTGHEGSPWEDVAWGSETPTSSPNMLMDGTVGSSTSQSRGDLTAFVIPGMVDMECEDSPCDYGDSGSEDEDEDGEEDMSEDEKHEK